MTDPSASLRAGNRAGLNTKARPYNGNLKVKNAGRLPFAMLRINLRYAKKRIGLSDAFSER